MFQRDGAILDEGDWLSLVLHRHHDIEPGLAQFADIGGKGHVPDFDDPALMCAFLAETIAEIGHRVGKAAHVLLVLRRCIGELDEEHGGGSPRTNSSSVLA